MMGTANHGVDLRGLEKLIRRSPEMFAKALERPAIQMLTWMNTGSPREGRTPPLKTGVLRGSGTAFVGDKLVGTTPSAGAAGTPAKTSSAKTPLTVHWVYNTDYAAKMHEHTGNWGDFTVDSKDAGNKWMELHIRADRHAFVEFIKKDFGKRLDALGATP